MVNSPSARVPNAVNVTPKISDEVNPNSTHQRKMARQRSAFFAAKFWPVKVTAV